LLLLFFQPHFELANRVAFRRKLDVGVRRVNLRTSRVAHERHADFLKDAGLHQARVEGVAEVVEANVPDSGTLERGLPRLLYEVDRAAVEIDHDAIRLLVLEEERPESVRERNLS
jgi:hypothetical protein